MHNIDMLWHMKSVHQCLPHFKARANVNLRDLRLQVIARNRVYRFTPQYVYSNNGQMQYTPYCRDDVQGFIGWLPYFNKLWPAATDKLVFKQYCVSNSLRTPAFWQTPEPAVRNALVKRRASSFGRDMRGPFERLDDQNPAAALLQGEYYEQFVVGKIAKAYYWNDKFVCLELKDMQSVTGDGRRSVFELILAKARDPGDISPAKFEGIVRYQRYRLDDVLPQATTIIVGYEYGSVLYRGRFTHENVAAAHASTGIGRQFTAAGAAFWASIPEEMRANTLYTVDAIVDRDSTVWFLEMNCNPTVHPDTYFAMFEGLYGPAETPAPDKKDESLLREAYGGKKLSMSTPIAPATAATPAD